MDLFNKEDAARGYYVSTNREGQQVEVALVTLSLAIITDRNVTEGAHPAEVAAIAAMVKKKIKAITKKERRSGHYIDQRNYSEDTVKKLD